MNVKKKVKTTDMVGLELGRFKIVGINRRVYPSGGTRNELVVICTCGHSQSTQRNRWESGDVHCGCNVEDISRQNWDEKDEEMYIEQFKKIDALKRKKRERELQKLKGNVTAKLSQKMVISL